MQVFWEFVSLSLHEPSSVLQTDFVGGMKRLAPGHIPHRFPAILVIKTKIKFKPRLVTPPSTLFECNAKQTQSCRGTGKICQFGKVKKKIEINLSENKSLYFYWFSSAPWFLSWQIFSSTQIQTRISQMEWIFFRLQLTVRGVKTKWDSFESNRTEFRPRERKSNCRPHSQLWLTISDWLNLDKCCWYFELTINLNRIPTNSFFEYVPINMT